MGPLHPGEGAPGLAGPQVVVLAGGPGTRLGGLTRETPKAMVQVEGKPFLEHQLLLLRSRGVKRLVYCLGYLGHMVQGYFGQGEGWGVSIAYSYDGDRLLGTGGALKRAEPLLDPEFLLVYGDSYVVLDYQGVLARLQGSSCQGVMVVYRNRDRYDRSNVELGGGMVRVYDKAVRTPSMEHIDAGVMALRKGALSLVPEAAPYPLEGLLEGLVSRGELLAYETGQRFYEVGSVEGLEEFRRLSASGAVST